MSGIIISKIHSVTGSIGMFKLIVVADDGMRFEYVKLSKGAGEALGKMEIGPLGVTWICGSAATRKLAKLYSLEYRKRAPGAGRSVDAGAGRSKRVTLWMTDKGKADLERIAKHEGRKLGQQVAAMALRALQMSDE
jgi:hypothetical protein